MWRRAPPLPWCPRPRACGGLYGIGLERLTHYALDATESRVIDAQVVVLEHASFNDPRDVWVEDDRITCLANMELAPVSPHRRGRAAIDTHLLEIPRVTATGSCDPTLQERSAVARDRAPARGREMRPRG